MIAKKPWHHPGFFLTKTGRQACLPIGTALLGSLSWIWTAQAGEIHLFRSLKADRVRVYQGTPGSGGGHPLVCQLQNGEVLAAFQAWEADSDWRVLSARSKDGGLHWSEPQVLVDSDKSEGNIALGVLKDGTVLLGYETFRFLRGKDPPTAQFLSYEVMRSSDHGNSWSSPVKIPQADSLALASYSSIIQLPDGTVLLPLYAYVEGKEGDSQEKSPATNFSYVYRSADGGQSWGDRSLIAAGFNETNLVRLKSGKLLAVMREERKPPGRSALAESTDGGRHWSRPRFVTAASQHPASLLQMPDGTVVLSHGVRHPPYGAQALLSRDGGQTWDRTRKIMLGYHSWGGGGYPCTIRLDSGHLLTLYYGSSPRGGSSFPFVEAVRWSLP
jgi:hypothetical protein